MWYRVSDLNDNPPVFLGTPYTISIPENMAPNTTVFRQQDHDQIRTISHFGLSIFS